MTASVAKRLATAALWAFALPLFAQTDISKTIPADAKIVLRMDVAGMRLSELGADLLTLHDARLREIKLFATQYAGLDLDLIGRAWVLSAKPDTGVVVFEGSFDAAQVRAKFGLLPNVTELKRDGCAYVARFKDDKKDRMQLGAIIDGHTLALGDEPSMEHYLEACAGKTPTVPADNAQLQKLIADKHQFIGTILGGPANWPDFDRNLAGFVKELWLTGDLTADATLQLAVTADTVEHAEGMELVLRGLQPLASDHPNVQAKPIVADAIKAAKVSRQERTVTVATTVPGVQVQAAASHL